ncbi:MAG TPA: UvrD-helicase domain-containing protein [Myxococcales bacterium LLY-WYZ-16_1]|nr:UvrD-helicase domain-containing protein [Myxococcales bacterium LLY-WYZ-16_1]
MSDLVDADARSRIRTALDRSLLIEAAAGTGKTRMLVERMVGALATGACGPEGLVAVTFTRAAAGELKLRLRQRLSRAREDSQGLPEAAQDHDPNAVRARLDEAFVRLDEARVSTIHGFCVDLLRSFPIEADVDPGFEELSEGEAERLFDGQMRRWFEAVLHDPPLGLRRALTWPSSGSDREEPFERIRKAAWDLYEARTHPQPWTRPASQVDLTPLLDELLELADLLGEAPPSLRRKIEKQNLDRLHELARRERARRRAGDEDPVAREADLFEGGDALRLQKMSGAFSPRITKTQLRDRLEAWQTAVKDARRVLQAELAADLQAILQEPIRRYEAEKARRSVLDYTDLLVRTRKLLAEPSVLERVRSGVQRLFVDEFQDTDPLQTEILLATCPPESGRLTLVGDPKQSIYGFRTADMNHYLEVRQALTDASVERVELRHSFRAVAELQQATNQVFGPVFETGPAQPGYVPLAGGPPSPNEVALIRLEAPENLGYRGPTKTCGRNSLAAGGARFLRWLFDASPIQVRDVETGALRRPRPADVGLLTRSIHPNRWGTDDTRPWVEAFEAFGLPFVLHRRQPATGREEVQALQIALACLEWPQDAYRVYSTLRGPLFGFTDAILFRHARRHGLRLQDDLPEPAEGADPDERALHRALSLLADLSRQRNRRPPAETLHQLLERTRAPAAWGHTARGPHALALVRHVEMLAHLHEQQHGGAFRRFVRELEDFREDQHAEVATHDQVDGIRIMSAHHAKGLEFPIVILAQPAWALKDGASRYRRGDLAAFSVCGCLPLDLELHREAAAAEDRAESMRLAYVASTRARDLLVVTSMAAAEGEPWFGPWWPALEIPNGTQPKPVWGLDPSPISDVENRPGGKIQAGPDLPAAVILPSSVTGGSFQLEHGVSDPQALQEGPHADGGRDHHARWWQRRIARREAGAVPERLLLRASEAPFDPLEIVGSIREIHLPVSSERPHGRRFGELVHGLLRQTFDPNGPKPDAEAIARRLGATEAEHAAALAVVQAAMQTPELSGIHDRPERWAEVPLTVPADGEVLEGVIDLLVGEADGSYTIYDFKTDLDLEPRRQRYRTQMRWYLWAIHEAWKVPVNGVLLRL